MIADTIDIEEYSTGKRSEGVFFGILTFSYKLTQSLIILILGVLLQVIGFDPNISQQAESTASWLGVIMACGSMISLVFAIIGYSRYNLDRAYVEAIQGKLAAKVSERYNSMEKENFL
jgi:glycoside/pentoside/hexuronide:cation symporter, GPH family